MTPKERAEKIETHGNAHNELVQALEEFPKEMWHYKPSPDDWSVHEIVVHITDSEANSYIRCRRFIAEPGETVMAYDEKGWAQALKYGEQSTEDALELFKWLRNNTNKLIRTLPERAWLNTIYHPENGIMTLDDWLDTYARHVTDHVEQMRRGYEAWRHGAEK
ncbi:MAG TPA: DinB family protein [Chloroflexia bacterium]|nr:DinB family protein [Chloroflexia bacterium]